MEKVVQFIEILMKKEDALFPFAFLIWLAYHYDPAVLKAFQQNLLSLTNTAVLAAWILLAEKLVSLWNTFAIILTILWLLWGLLMLFIPWWKERAELNWAISAKMSLGWLLRSSLWWWNLYAIQILLSIPVASVRSYPKTLVYPFPFYAFLNLAAWIYGAIESSDPASKTENTVIGRDDSQLKNEREQKYRQPLSSRFVSYTKSTDDDRQKGI